MLSVCCFQEILRKQYNKMDNYALCRVCFASNVKMHNVVDTSLQDLYESLTNVKLTNFLNVCPSILCSLCYALLKRCHSFQQAAARAGHLLAQLYLDSVELTREVILKHNHPAVHNYSITQVELVSVGDEEETESGSREIKQEIDKDGDSQEEEDITNSTELKSEYDCIQSDGTLSAASDPEEDIPLDALKNASRKRKKDGETSKTGYNGFKLDFQEVILTEDQQKEAMSARAVSINYLHAPHRCTLCFRGYNNLGAFTNHMDKHVESSGSHVCRVCSLRYRTERLLRAHTHAAHERQYICNKCNVVCSTRHQASDHARIHTGDLYECKLCGKRFHARTSYLTHLRASHAGAARVVCVACGEQFVSRHGLRMHRARAHTDTHAVEESTPRAERYCAHCRIQFLCRRAFLTHTFAAPAHKQNAATTKECPICKKVVSDSISEHLALHREELKGPRAKPPPPRPEAKLDCDQCTLSFATRGRLTAHVRRVHLGLKYDKNLVCERCGKKCTSAATLRYHQRTHTGERPHTCAAGGCNKRFTDANQLRIHTRTHTGERPYECERCGRRFAQKPALNRHYRVHTGAKPYSCQLCSKSFSQSNSLHTHVNSVHLKKSTKKRRTRPSGDELMNKEH